MRVIIDADAKNEIDDQWAIMLALLSSDRDQTFQLLYDRLKSNYPPGNSQ